MPAWLTLDAPAPPLLLWVLGSVLVYVLGANVLWLARETRRLPASVGSVLYQAGRFLYYLGVPYLVMGGWPLEPHRGLLAPVTLGLAGLDATWTVSRWLEAAGTQWALAFWHWGSSPWRG